MSIIQTYRLELCTPEGLVTRPRRRGDTEGSTIDLCLAETDIREHLIKTEIARVSGDSDHRPISSEFRIQTSTVESRERRLWRKLDKGKLIDTLRRHMPVVAEPAPGTVTAEHIDTAMANIARALKEAIDASVPLINVSPKSKPGWTEECTRLIKERKRCLRIYQRTQSDDDYETFQRIRRRCKTAIRKATRDEHRERVSKSKTVEGLWALSRWLKNRTTIRTSFTPDIKEAGGGTQRSVEGKVRVFKETFFPVPPEADLSDINEAEYQTPLDIPNITENEIKEAIGSAAADKAPGPDGIPNRALKEGSSELVKPLTMLFNQCLEIGYCPTHFKESTTIVLRKPGKSDYTEPKAYRPIALLNTIGKILDKVLASRMLYLVERYKLLPITHTGGRRASSCEHALHLCIEKIYSAWQSNSQPTVSMLLLDVSGAFDNVSHQRLIHCLKKRMMPIPIVKYIESLLQGRHTKIVLPEGTSSTIQLPTGIPQGVVSEQPVTRWRACL
jgi:Reverse transcriptase (RNA-dependent DNA polymerase)